MPVSLTATFAALVAAGDIVPTPAQEAIVGKLAALDLRLAAHRMARKSSSLGWLFGSRPQSEEPLRGLYIHGEVGRGKTMLMDLFYDTSPVRRRRRAHFHEFMADVHERIFAYRQAAKRGEGSGEDPIRLVAADLAAEAWLLCFDEFHVTDIADAMMLGRLFAQLFERGVVVVATSNVPPDDLYKDGLNRALFLPFIALLEQHMEVVRLDGAVDFRLAKLAGVKVWYVPADAAADTALDDAWRRLTAGQAETALTFTVKGRPLRVPRAALGCARFSFHDLCEQPLAAVDYLRVAREFHTLVIDHIPRMTPDMRNQAKRFILLIDTLYDTAVKLLASADAEPRDLYEGTDGFEAGEFKRTASRLIEMGSEAYLALPHGRHVLAAGGSSEGLVET